MKIKSIKQFKKLADKKVLLRVDFNVPLANGEVKDDYKIVASLATIRFLLRYRCKIIIITHLGRPFENKKNLKRYSVKPVAARLATLLDKKVWFVDDCLGFKVSNKVSRMRSGEILMLENLRFKEEEKKNSKKFAKQLASLADIYINNAFAVSHRRHASLAAIKNYLPAFAGLLLENEIKNLNKILHPKKPLAVVIGGVKTTTKIPLIKKFYKSQKSGIKVLIGGALANNFLAAHSLEVGNSLVDKQSTNITKKLKNKNVLLPVDVIVKDKNNRAVAKSVNKVEKDDTILDIGPKTIKLYSNFIKKADTIIWNGPMGMFEDKHFKHGTLSIARVIASRSTGRAFGVAGGGETIKALKMTKMQDYIDWISTGGGAMLTFLAGGKMPGLKGIVR